MSRALEVLTTTSFQSAFGNPTGCHRSGRVSCDAGHPNGVASREGRSPWGIRTGDTSCRTRTAAGTSKRRTRRGSAPTLTQKQAQDRAWQIVHNAGGGEVVTHGRDGQIRDSDTIAPGNDPNPPRDKK